MLTLASIVASVFHAEKLVHHPKLAPKDDENTDERHDEDEDGQTFTHYSRRYSSVSIKSLAIPYLTARDQNHSHQESGRCAETLLNM